MTQEQHNKIFNYFLENHGIILLESEINEIEFIVKGEDQYLKEANQVTEREKTLITDYSRFLVVSGLIVIMRKC
jgi:hypothetical protein